MVGRQWNNRLGHYGQHGCNESGNRMLLSIRLQVSGEFLKLLFTCACILMGPLPSFAVTMGPVSWTYPAELVCTNCFDALGFESLTTGDSTL